MNIKDLNKHNLNPRTITKKKFNKLEATLEKYGDLSGVVFNVATKELVGGHMRIEAFKKLKSKIEYTHKNDEPDKQGTTALGFIVIGDNKYNYREVHWESKEVHEAAMLVANKGGGDWDIDLLANNWDSEWLQDEVGFETWELGGVGDESDDSTFSQEDTLSEDTEIRVQCKKADSLHIKNLIDKELKNTSLEYSYK